MEKRKGKKGVTVRREVKEIVQVKMNRFCFLLKASASHVVILV